ncbi:MAG: hypothetical protein JWP92_2770 [Caulobacter sp.]|nr:hypothetical protein [Caulobacter sp.]
MRQERTSLRPALLGSLALHGLIAASLLVAWPWLKKPISLGEAVPVTIVSEGPTNVRPAVEAPTEQTALSDTSVPDADQQPPAPTPAPIPQPAATAPPKTTQVPPPSPKPAPAKPADKPSLDLDALAASLNKGKKPTGKPQSAAAKGPSRAETAVSARPAAGAATAISTAALGRLQGELQDRWNPPCEVEGGSSADVRLVFVLGPGGRVVGQPQSSGASSPSQVVKAASDRAVRALLQASPFPYLPAELYGQKIALNFNAKQACSGR